MDLEQGTTTYEKLNQAQQGQKEFRMKRAMTRKRHRPEEIVAKLSEVDEALSQGKSLEDVAKSLGVSLMTLHRWRTEYESTDLKGSPNDRLTEFLATH